MQQLKIRYRNYHVILMKVEKTVFSCVSLIVSWDRCRTLNQDGELALIQDWTGPNRWELLRF